MASKVIFSAFTVLAPWRSAGGNRRRRRAHGPGRGATGRPARPSARRSRPRSWIDGKSSELKALPWSTKVAQAPALGQRILIPDAAGDHVAVADLVAIGIPPATASGSRSHARSGRRQRRSAARADRLVVVGGDSAYLQAAEQAMAAGKAGQALWPWRRHGGRRRRPAGLPLPLDVELQAVAPWLGSTFVVGLQQRVADPRHQEAAQPGVVAQLVLLAHPVQRNHPLPTIGPLAVPFAAKRSAACSVSTRSSELVAAGEAQLVGERRIEGNLVPGADVLPWCGDFRLESQAMSFGIHPMAGPVEPRARARRRSRNRGRRPWSGACAPPAGPLPGSPGARRQPAPGSARRRPARPRSSRWIAGSG